MLPYRCCSTRWMVSLLFVTVLVGCAEEMPRPPVEKFSNRAEGDFNWAMERLKHAIEMIDPPRNMGIRVKRDMDYELFPPTKENSNYTARVTITSKTTFLHDKPISANEERKQKQAEVAKRVAEQKAKRDPFARPGEKPITGSTTITDELIESNPGNSEIVAPPIPQQKLDIKEDFKLEYVDGKWKQLNRAKEEHIQLWFDYALQQGEYAL